MLVGLNKQRIHNLKLTSISNWLYAWKNFIQQIGNVGSQNWWMFVCIKYKNSIMKKVAVIFPVTKDIRITS